MRALLYHGIVQADLEGAAIPAISSESRAVAAGVRAREVAGGRVGSRGPQVCESLLGGGRKLAEG
jgi:hypothetical protein